MEILFVHIMIANTLPPLLLDYTLKYLVASTNTSSYRGAHLFSV